MAESGLLSAGGPLPLTKAVPGNLSTGPSGHAGPPYGRTEHGRSRGARHSYPRVRKGVKVKIRANKYEYLVRRREGDRGPAIARRLVLTF